MSYNIGPKIGIEGEKEFRNSIKNINDAYKALQAETKAVSSAFAAQGDEQGRLRAVSALLEKQIDEQKRKQALLADAVQKATAKFGENSVEATRLRGAFFDTQATVANLENELKDAQTQLKQAAGAMEDLSEDTESATDAAVSFKDIMGANIIADVVMDGIRELGSLVKDFATGSIEAAATVNASQAQFEQTFGGMADAAHESLEEISDDVKIATTRMQDSFTQIYAFAKTAGADSAEALNIASRAMVAATDSAAYYDKSIEEAAETLQSFLKGNYANDAALGIAATETTRNAKANELYAKSFQKLSEAQKVDVLLAMVEAGNKASGAIGQAARESDSWANVTGELSEMFRQLQANAGQSALKSLTPVIKDITAAGYELIEDIDWDAFGDTVADIIEFGIDHGPAVVKAIASVTAGIMAMKAVKRAEELWKLAKRFYSVGEAAKAAGEASKAASAASNFSGWGIAATVIGTAVGVITEFCLSVEDSETKLDKALNSISEDLNRARDSYKNCNLESEGAVITAQAYADKLFELEAAGLNTADAQSKYAAIVAELNELIPELNLEIDSQTGLISQNREELLGAIEDWKIYYTTQAMQDLYTESMRAYGETQAAILEAEAELNRELLRQENIEKDISSTTERMREIEAELIEVSKALLPVISKNSKETQTLKKKQAALVAEYNELDDSMFRLILRLVQSKDSQEEQNKSLTNAKRKLALYSAQAEATETMLDDYTRAVNDASSAQDWAAVEAEMLAEAIADVEAAYQTVAEESRASIDKQIGLFEDLSEKSDWSAKKIIDNWNSQKEAFSNYSENLKKAVDLGLDEVLVNQLSDGSKESMQILDALVNDTDISIEKINQEFAQMQEGRAAVATAMAGIAYDVDAAMADAEGSVSTAMADMKSAAYAGGKAVVDGAANGITINQWVMGQAMQRLANFGLQAFNGVFKIRSPSKAMEEGTGYVVDGGVVGVNKNAWKFETAMAEMATAGMEAFSRQDFSVYADIPNYAPVASQQSSVTHSYGGVTIQIEQQPGESADALARRVADVLMHEIEVKEGAF